MVRKWSGRRWATDESDNNPLMVVCVGEIGVWIVNKDANSSDGLRARREGG